MNILVSYWSLRRADLDRLFAAHGPVEVFADSGAYSAMTVGAPIDLDDYARWVLRWRHLFAAYSNLDVIGNPAATARNQALLEDRYGLTPLPVFHTGSPWGVLEGLVARYPYVALGGMARKAYQAPTLIPWLIRCFRLAGEGSRFHGFGATDWQIISSFPWRSVDSTTWQAGNRFGAQLIFARNRLFQTRAHRLPLFDRDLRALGFSAAEATAACGRGTAGGDNALANRIALAAIEAAQAHLRRRFATDVRLYLAGLV